MSAEFVLPDWMPRAEPAPPPSDASEVDPHRVEGLVNRFIAAKQDALFGAPDAYYRQTGAAAVDGASGILGRLEALREATLDAAGDDGGLRRVLGPRLDLHIADAADGIDRHVAPQRDALSRQIIGERQTLLERAAALEHSDDEKLDGLAEANAGAALELARLTGEPDGPAADAARSAIWRTAIDRRLANGNGAQALALFERVKDRLAAADRLALDAPVQVARHDQAAEQWLARQTATDRRPLQERLDADPDLSPEARLVVRAKADARDSAEQSARLAKVQELDDRMVAAAGALATRPGAYAPGTLARIADAYDAAGAPDKAALARRTAAQEAFVLPFAQASAEKQQRLIDELPDGDLRDTAVAIQRHQADAFARDAFAAGTALYADVGPPVPIDDIEGRVRQARQIAQRRGIPVAPFTEGEIDGMRRSEEEPQQTEQTEQRTEAAPQDENGAARQSPNDPRDDEASLARPDPNIVLVAGNGKEKRPPLPG